MRVQDIVVVGAGAAGLMAAIWAARQRPGVRVTALDGMRRLGAKILVSGGGRCNVTHDEVSELDFCGSSPHTIRKVLRRFSPVDTSAFFRDIGVPLKREGTGKLFPQNDSARTVLNALIRAAGEAGVNLEYPRRVSTISPASEGFTVAGDWGTISTGRVILATGGKSLPKSGSDGQGYELAVALGHSVTSSVLPALVPLTLPEGHFVRKLAGLTVPGRLEVRDSTGHELAAVDGSALCTHFGLSGPAVLDISRHYLHARTIDAGSKLIINWRPGLDGRGLASDLRQLGRRKVVNYLRGFLPARLAEALCRESALDLDVTGACLTRDGRTRLLNMVAALELPVSGHRGFNFAETTAGGIPLRELFLDRMESRVCPGLFLCGEICDVDGRIGGFNFQWAWASGYVAGVSAARFDSCG